MKFDPTSASLSDTFDPTTAVPEDAPPVRAVLQTAVKQNPDQVARATALGKQYGVPTDLVVRNLQSVEFQAAVDAADAKLQTSPKLAAAMRKRPDIAPMAHDDLGPLTEIEQAVRKYGELKAWEGPAPTLRNIALGLAKAVPQAGKAITAGLDAQMSDFLESVGLITLDPIVKADRARKLAQASGAADFTRPKFESDTAQAIYGGVESTLRMIPGLAASIATRSSAPMLAAAGVQTQGEAYGKYKTRGASGAQAFVGATGEGIVEVLTELLPAEFLTKRLGKAGVGEFISGLLAREIPGEQIATLLQDAIDTAVANPNKTWGQYLTERPDAAYSTLVSTLTQSALMGGVHTAARRLAQMGDQEQQAGDASDALKDALKTAGAAALRERSPEQFRALMGEMTDGKIYVDGEVLNQLPEGVRAALPQAVQDQIATAAATGDVVEISTADALTIAPGTALEEVLVEHARTDPFAMSKADAVEATKLAQSSVLADAQRVIQQAQDTEARQAEYDAIHKLYVDQLNAAARFRPAVNEAKAHWLASFYTTMAARTGMTPAQFQAAHPVSILGEPSSAGQAVMDQPKLGEVSVEGYHFSKEDRSVITTGAFGTGLLGSGRDEYLNATDKRRSKRAYFYVDKGTGINPEAGVGGRGHRATLTNVYDADTDPLRLTGGSQADFETKVLDAGFSGYLSRLDGTQSGQVIMLGDQTIQPEVLGPLGKTSGKVVPPKGQRPSTGRDTVVDALQVNTALPSGSPTLARWQELLARTPEVLDALREAGVFDGDQTQTAYKSDLVKRFQTATEAPVYEQGPRVEPSTETDLDRSSSLDAVRVSPRNPTGARATETGLGETRLQPTIASMPDAMVEKTAAEFVKYPNFARLTGTSREILEQAKEHMKDNLRALMNAFPDDLYARARMWYVGGNRIARALSEEYGVPVENVALAMAALSPQKNWFENVSSGERVIDIVVAHSQEPWSPEMTAVANARGWFEDLKISKYVGDAEGKTLRDMYDPADPESFVRMAWWVRAYDEANNPRTLSVITPEGTFIDKQFSARADGAPTPLRWGSAGDIGKAIAALVARTPESRSKIAGGAHKVRSFFNNIAAPYSTGGDVTIDTHAVAAALMRPLGGATHEVQNVLSGAVSKDDAALGFAGIGGSSITGSVGAYGVYADAYRELATEFGMLPREVQSITWEAVRLLFDAKGAELKRSTSETWLRFSRGEITHDQATAAIFGLAGGIGRPDWSAEQPAPQPAGSSYRRLPAAGVLEQSGDLTDGQTGDRGGRYSSGSLAPLEGAPAIVGATGPDARLVAVAEQYARDNGIVLRRQGSYARVDPERAARIAAAYEAMPHAPNDPAVQAAYADLIRQTLAQYQALVDAGYSFTFFDSNTDPYQGNPWNAMRDLRANQRMAVYGTYDGFGSGGQVNVGLADPNGGPNLDPATVLEALRVVGAEVEASAVHASDTEPTLVVKVKKALTKEQGDFLSGLADQEAIAQRTDDEKGALFGPKAQAWGPFNPEYFVTPTGARASEVANPMLADTGLEWPDQAGVLHPVAANDLFRAVHDAFGHGLEGAGFRAEGEENAWQAHVRLFAGPAVGAITSETRGQNSWLNYGPHGETNRAAKVEDTVFAEQKTGLMPEWTWTEGRVEDADGGVALEQAAQTPRGTFNPKTLELVLNPNANLSTFFHETGHFFLEVMADIASQPNAPAQIVEDMGTFLKWAGVKDLATWNALDLDGKRQYHERWAESIEQYVMEGKAPSVELQPLMRRFATWLKSVYGSIKQFLMARGQAAPGGEALNQVDPVAQAQTEGYEGADAGEAAEWLAAKAKGLDMSEAARMERARAMGFDTSKKLYHSTLADTKQFAPMGKFMGFAGTSGISVTDSPEMASRYLERYGDFSWDRTAFQKNVIPVFIKPGKVLERDTPLDGMANMPVAGRPGETRLVKLPLGAPLPADYVPAHKRMGYDTLIRNDAVSRKGPVKHSDAKNAIKGKEYVLTDPSQVRSVFAAFDPDNAASGNLLAQDPAAQPGPPMALNDDIRRVMDRMLATDEQIAQANEVAGLVPNEDADALAAERLNKRSIADLKWSVRARDQVITKLRKAAAAIEKDLREQVTVEVDQTPEMRAKRALDALTVSPEHAGTLAEHKAARKAAEASVRDEVKATLLSNSPNAKGIVKGQLLMKNKRDIDNKVDAAMIKWDQENPAPKRPVNATDADVATIADSFGFETVDAMLQAIDAFGSRREAIDGLTEKRMLEEHGDLIDERAISEAANEAVHNEARARSLATELRTQSEMLNPRQDTGETNAKGSRITVNVLVEAAKQFAANVVSRTTLRDLTARAWQHTAAERRAAARWQQATTAGKTEEAVKAKQDQMLNHAAAKAAIDAKAEAKKILDFFKRVTKGNDETVVEKGRDVDIVNAARAVLAAYGVETATTKRADEYLEAVGKNDPETFNVLAPMIEGATRNAQPLDAITFEELQALNEEIQAMWFLAKRSRQMEVDGDLLDVQDVAEEVYARLEEIGIPDTLPGETGALTNAEIQARRWLQQVPALLRRVEQWAEAKDGKFGGPFSRFIFGPVKTAADAYRTARLDYRKRFQVLVDAIAPMMPTKTIAAPELGYTFGRGHNGIGMSELLHAIAHTGNESNKRKLLLGRGWAADNGDGTIDTARWDSFIARLAADGTLQREHFDFVQGVWDLMGQTKPLAQQTHRAVFGRYFAEVTADAFVDPFGVARSGGYIPAQADPLLVTDADLRELLETDNAGMSQAFPATNKGFTKSRVEYNRPLKLDLRTLPQHIDKVLLFSHMEPAVRGVARLLRQPKVSQPLARVDPAAIGGMLKPWLNRSARQTVETPVSADAGLNRVLSTTRARVGMALMFANVSNTLQQITGFSSATLKVKPALMMRAAAQFIAHPKQFSQAVRALSPFMADRASNEVSVLSDTMEKILINPGVFARAESWTRQHAYFLQTAFDNVMSPIIWSGAYNQGVAEGMDERMAIRFADGVIRQTQGSTLPEDVSRIETGPAYARVFTQFIGYFNMLANTNATALQQIAQEQGLKKGAGRAFGVVMLGLLVPIWVAEAIAQGMRGGPDDEDRDGYLDDWLAAVFGFGTIRGILSGIPFLGQAAQAGVNRFNSQPADDKFSLSPTVSVLESAVGAPASVYGAIVDDKNAQKAVRDVSALITVATGLPGMAVARPLGYLAGVAQGRVEPTGPVDAARGLVTGAASPESKRR